MDEICTDSDDANIQFLPDTTNINRPSLGSPKKNSSSNNTSAGNPDDVTGHSPEHQSSDIFGGNARLVISEVDESLNPSEDKSSNRRHVVLAYNSDYLQSCPGMLRVAQVILSVTMLIVFLTSHGIDYESYLLLPYTKSYAFVVFVIIFSMLVSVLFLFMYACNLYQSIPYNWPLTDMVVNMIIAILYLSGSTLVACTHDFYRTPKSAFNTGLSNHLLVVVVVGYVCMFVYGLTAFHSYQKIRGVTVYRITQPLLEDQDQFEI